MATVTFQKDFMLDMFDENKAIIEDNVIDNSSWLVRHEMIFQHDGKFYRTEYQVGATEMWDEGPWEYDDVVNCEEVEQQEVLVKKWVPKA